jgi:hypothetical protein
MGKQRRRRVQEHSKSEHPTGSENAASLEQSTGSELSPMTETVRGRGVDEALGAKLATVATVGLAVALIEVEWIPGLLLGAAAIMAPDLLPAIRRGLRPIAKGVVRAGYYAKDAVAGAGEQIQIVMNEVHGEQPRTAERSTNAQAIDTPGTESIGAEEG